MPPRWIPRTADLAAGFSPCGKTQGNGHSEEAAGEEESAVARKHRMQILRPEKPSGLRMTDFAAFIRTCLVRQVPP